jgi:GntR family transcriptional regulator
MKRGYKWKSEHPIYRQLMDQLIAGILDKTYLEGAMLPSIRTLAERFDVNAITAAKACRELQREGIVEAVRGEGLNVVEGARSSVLKRERVRFLKEEWPDLKSRIVRLEVDLRTLLATE